MASSRHLEKPPAHCSFPREMFKHIVMIWPLWHLTCRYILLLPPVVWSSQSLLECIHLKKKKTHTHEGKENLSFQMVIFLSTWLCYHWTIYTPNILTNGSHLNNYRRFYSASCYSMRTTSSRSLIQISVLHRPSGLHKPSQLSFFWWNPGQFFTATVKTVAD